jgi:HlyD family secretion protein
VRRRQLAAAAATGIVLVAGGGVAYAQTNGAAGSYRTTTVTVGDVDKTLGLSGTITASARRDLSFGAAGTVKTVRVASGDAVSSGDTLATLDATDLKTAVTTAKATLAKAKAQLEADQTSQASTVADATTPSSSSTPDTSTPSTSKPSTPDATKAAPTTATPAGGSGSKPSRALAGALKKLASQQTAVTSAQTTAADAIAAAKAALAQQVEACKAAETDEPADPGADDDPDQTGDAAPAAGLSDACTTALDDVQAAQDVVAGKQDALQKALQDLSATLASAVKTISDSSSDSAPTTSTPTTSTPTTAPTTAPSTETGSSGSSSSKGSGSSGGAGTVGGTVTAATLAKDQASIDTAAAQLTEARRSLSSAKLTAPFSGQILSVSVAKGDVVGTSDVAVIIAGDGGTTVTTTVTLDQIDSVKTSQTASVTPAGASEPVGGTVSSIGLLPSTSADSTSATYPVTIDLDEDVPAPEGSAASVEVVIGTAKDVLTMPSSAVSTDRRPTVTLLTEGNPVVTPVTVGVVGSTRTSITEGLKLGQKVVIADLDAALPSGDSESTRLPGIVGQVRPPGGRQGDDRG